jgi:hypothetical protein
MYGTRRIVRTYFSPYRLSSTIAYDKRIFYLDPRSSAIPREDYYFSFFPSSLYLHAAAIQSFASSVMNFWPWKYERKHKGGAKHK